MHIDKEKATEVALAVMSLTEHQDGPTSRISKTVDWNLVESMHQKGWISDPKGKSKSIALTNNGASKAAECRLKYLTATDKNTEFLTALEHGLWQADKRYNQHWFESVLHPDFFEIGRSGRQYHYADMFPVGSGEINCQMPLPNFSIAFPTSDTALITYESHVRTAGETLSARRTSLWLRQNGMWLLRQHQGTPFNATPDTVEK